MERLTPGPCDTLSFYITALIRDLCGPPSLPRNHGRIALFFPSAGHSLASGRLRYPPAGQRDLEGPPGRVLDLPHSFKRACGKARETVIRIKRVAVIAPSLCS